MQKRFLGVLALTLTPGLARGEGPTYRKDVAPILLKNCAGCHRPGEVAPRPAWKMAGDGFAIPEAFQDRLGPFDTNKDGRLSAAELDAMPEPARERVKAAIRARMGVGNP